jgi:ribosome-associated heat shock protein Hsp15
MSEVRIDKWMWATRIFKTRSIAVEACKKNRVTVNGVLAKPSRMIKAGDEVGIRKPPVTYSFRVLALTANRLNAKLLPAYLENITPPEQYEILELQKINGFVDRARGTGRPTKKDRRDLDSFHAPDAAADFDFDFDF